MNKLKLFFLTLFLGFSAVGLSSSTLTENSNVNTMIHTQAAISETIDESFVPIERIDEVTIVNTSLTVGSTTDIFISYYPSNATERIIVKTNKDNLILTELNDPEVDGERGKVKGKIAAINPAELILSFHGKDGRIIDYKDALGNLKTSPKIVIKPFETISDIISNALSSTPVIIFIVSLAATVIARVSIKIFRFGVNYKSNFATVEQQQNFENSMRNELRTSKSEIQDNLLKICLREINRETKPVKELQKIATDMKTDRQMLDIKLDEIDSKYNEIKRMTDNYNRLEAKVNRMQYGESTQDIRRVGK